MIVTRQFVFLHLHKSGGTFISRLLLEFLPDARQIGYHLPRRYLPPDFEHLPVLGTVRNPWSYYVSWYSFQAAMQRPNPLFMVASDNRRLDFAGTIRNLLTLADDPDRLATVMKQLPARFPNRGINLTQSCLAPLAGSGLGFYSFLYRRMYGDLSNTTLLDTAALRTDLLKFLERSGIAPSARMREAALRSAPANTSTHGHYSDYYDSDLEQLVAKRDAEIVERHHYCFEQARSVLQAR